MTKVVILASGNGQRFKDDGFNVPKVLLPVPDGGSSKLMINKIADNVIQIFDKNITEFVVVKRKEHIFELETIIKTTYIDVEETTGGAACSLLLAKDYIDKYESVLVVNSDQVIEVDDVNFNTFFNMVKNNYSFIFTFELDQQDNKWSFAKLDKDGDISKVAEKQQISNLATCGLYYFNKGKTLLDGLYNMMDDESNKFNNEWYLAPVYNFIKTYSKVFNVSDFHGLGTPVDYIKYLNSFQLDYDKVSNQLISMEVNF